MRKLSRHEAIQAGCFHPTGSFVRFEIEEIEQSVADRLDQQMSKYPNNLAIKAGDHQMMYDELNTNANRLAHALLDERGGGEGTIALLLKQGPKAIASIRN